jgi:alkanesulfonate monooxygenase SsuD/methylene tetrahydromethanopterin reductase-like flavin-dependent oxidoreductase (luciferase family)
MVNTRRPNIRVRGLLLRGQRFTRTAQTDTAALPPIIIGGQGAKRTPALAAKFATEFNVAISPLDTVTTQFDRVRAAADAAGRPPDSMTYSVSYPVCAGRNDAEISRRASAINPELGDLHPLVGTPSEIVDKLAPFVEAGVQRMYLQLVDWSDLDHLTLLADELATQFR